MSKKDFPPTVRRVVTGHDQHGKSYVLVSCSNQQTSQTIHVLRSFSRSLRRVVWKDHTQLPVRVCPPDTPAEARTVRVTELWQTSRVSWMRLTKGQDDLYTVIVIFR